MKSYLTALLLFLPFLSGAQDLASYELIHCSGKVPADFTTRTGSKVNQDISEQLSDGDTRKAKQTKSDFLLHSNYMVDELLMSGSVLFGDPVTNYVNSVVDVILAHDPELRKKLRFYCIKSNTVNAFCTNQGMIFVTLGLISKLDNEAQLAYILCHEISHYTENHVINSYIEAEKIFNQDEKNRNIGYEGNIAKLSSYSRQVELQADSLGLELLMRSSYSVEEALTALEKLKHAELPAEEQQFDYAFLESSAFKFPKDFTLSEDFSIDDTGDEDDRKSSHPNVAKRLSKITGQLEGKRQPGQLFLADEDAFYHIRDVCRFEGIRISISNMQYVRAIYDAAVLQKRFPDNRFLEASICKAIYLIGKYKHLEKWSNLVDGYDSYQGNISAAYYFFEQLNNQEVMALSLLQLSKGERSNYMKSVRSDVLKDLENASENIDSYFANRVTPSDSAALLRDSISSGFLTYQILDAIDNASFIVESNDVFTALTREQVLLHAPKEASTALSRSKALENARRLKRHKKRNRLRLGADKIVFIDPDYVAIDERKGIKLMNSETQNRAFYDCIAKQAKASKLEAEVLSAKLFEGDSATAYNGLSRFNEWAIETQRHKRLTGADDIVAAEGEFVGALAEKHGTRYLAYSQFVVYKAKKEDVAKKLLYGLFTMQFYLPFAVHYAVSPNYFTFFHTLIFDVESGKVCTDELYFAKYKANRGTMNSWTYDLMLQLKDQPKPLKIH